MRDGCAMDDRAGGANMSTKVVGSLFEESRGNENEGLLFEELAKLGPSLL